MSKLYIVGIGPGKLDYLTIRAYEVLQKVDVVVGYGRYVEQIAPLIRGKTIFMTGMRDEVRRCLAAIKLTIQGHDTALVCGGDPGVYGLAGLCLQICAELNLNLNVEIIPGITAALAGASLLGAPLMRDFVVLNLSDILIPWEEIEHKLRKALEGNFTIVIYNPCSKKRHNIEKVLNIARQYYNNTYIAIVKNALREGQEITTSKLENIDPSKIDMNTIVIICSPHVHLKGKWLIAERGYKPKLKQILNNINIMNKLLNTSSTDINKKS